MHTQCVSVAPHPSVNEGNCLLAYHTTQVNHELKSNLHIAINKIKQKISVLQRSQVFASGGQLVVWGVHKYFFIFSFPTGVHAAYGSTCHT